MVGFCLAHHLLAKLQMAIFFVDDYHGLSDWMELALTFGLAQLANCES